MTTQQHFVIGQATDPGLKREESTNQDAIGAAEQAGGEVPYSMLILVLLLLFLNNKAYPAETFIREGAGSFSDCRI